MLMVIVIGRWSEDRSLVVFHVVFWNRLFVIVVMSGEVGCWLGLLGTLVGVSRLRVTWSDVKMMSSMVVPLWSVVGENHRGECAFTSPAMMWFGRVNRWLKRLVMSLSSCGWWGLLVSLGGMYRLVM